MNKPALPPDEARRRQRLGARCALKPWQVARIKRFLVEGMHTQVQLARAFGVSLGAIANIKNGVAWAWVEPETLDANGEPIVLDEHAYRRMAGDLELAADSASRSGPPPASVYTEIRAKLRREDATASSAPIPSPGNLPAIPDTATPEERALWEAALSGRLPNQP